MTATSAKPAPVFQCDCTRCGRELFDGTPRQFYRLCQDCADEEYWASKDGRQQQAEERRARLEAYRASRAS